MNRLISVIVPVYNVKEYLEECILSIRQQTYQYLEIILVDDGSSDGSGNLCDKYAEIDDRISVIHRKNGGLSAARNSGINVALGDYLVFVDSDDMLHPRMIEVLYQNMNMYDADISICSHEFVRGDVSYRDVVNKKLMKPKENVWTGRECIKKFYNKDLSLDMIVMWNKLYKIEVFKTLRFPEGKIQEDEYINYQILYSAEKCFYTDLQLYYYRKRTDSIMGDIEAGRKFEQHFFCMLEYYQKRISFFFEKEDTELYGIMALMFQRMLIESYVNGNFSGKKKVVHYLEKAHLKNFKDNIIRNRNVSILDKMRGLLFVLNKDICKKIKNRHTI